MSNKVRKLEPRTVPSRLDTPTDLSKEAVRAISAALNAPLADTFALYLKIKNFHWHSSGPHFRDYHLLLDEQAEQLEGSSDILAERARKVGGTTIWLADEHEDVATASLLENFIDEAEKRCRFLLEASRSAERTGY